MKKLLTLLFLIKHSRVRLNIVGILDIRVDALLCSKSAALAAVAAIARLPTVAAVAEVATLATFATAAAVAAVVRVRLRARVYG